jgi:hypothetical protein
VRNEHITPKSAKSIAKKMEAKQQKQQKVSYKNDSTRHAVKRTFASQFQKCLPHFSSDIKSSGRPT